MNWNQYYKNIQGRGVRPLVREALLYAKKGRALDVGAGDMVDSTFLLEQGFVVDALDNSDASEEYARAVESERLKYTKSSFESFSYPKDTYDLVSAQFALPFCDPQVFPGVFKDIKNSLKKGGVLCVNLFGIRDEWHTGSEDIVFLSKEEVIEALKPLSIHVFREIEQEGETASGVSKHWHLFEVIAEK